MTLAWEWDPARHLVLVANHAWTGDIRINDLPGCGRMDAVCRCVNAALWLSHDLRRDARFHVVLGGPPSPPRTVSFHPEYLRRVSPDERNIGAHLRNALSRARALREGDSVRAAPGITVHAAGLEDLLNSVAGALPLVQLDRDGVAAEDWRGGSQAIFVLGDHRGLSEEQLSLLRAHGATRLSLGPKEILASHAIILLHGLLDRRESNQEEGSNVSVEANEHPRPHQ
jgi:tRNA (pseudouridine54-N1)-methyltransferase